MGRTERDVPATHDPWASVADDALMLLTRNGQTRAFDALVRRYEVRLLRSAHRYLGDAAWAQEAAQCAVIALYSYVPRYQPRDKLERLLWRILLNECRLVRRRQRGEARALRRLSIVPLAPVSTPAAAFETTEQSKRVSRAVAGLSDKLRAAIVLRFTGDLPYEEIAEILAVPVGTVKSRIAAGLSKLKIAMTREEED